MKNSIFKRRAQHPEAVHAKKFARESWRPRGRLHINWRSGYKVGRNFECTNQAGGQKSCTTLTLKNKPIIVKVLSHKLKSKVEKRRVMLKRIKASDFLPSASVSAALNRKPHIFINENLTSYRWSIIKKANNMRKDGWVLSYFDDGLVQSVWTLDGKVCVKTSPDGSL